MTGTGWVDGRVTAPPASLSLLGLWGSGRAPWEPRGRLREHVYPRRVTRRPSFLSHGVGTQPDPWFPRRVGFLKSSTMLCAWLWTAQPGLL